MNQYITIKFYTKKEKIKKENTLLMLNTKTLQNNKDIFHENNLLISCLIYCKFLVSAFNIFICLIYIHCLEIFVLY